MKLFRWIWKCPLLFLLLLSWLGLTGYTISEGKLEEGLKNNAWQNPVFAALLLPEDADALEDSQTVEQEDIDGIENTEDIEDKDLLSEDTALAEEAASRGYESEESDTVGQAGRALEEEQSADSAAGAGDENSGQSGAAKETEPGVTRYKKYKKQQTDSPYYSDPGKVALTTDYDYQKVKKSYFNDAVFIGDSRTVGMQDYSGLDNAAFFAKTGLNIYELMEDAFIKDPKTGKDVTLPYMMKHYQYGKIYIMIGINELGTGNTGTFYKAYARAIKKLRKWQPDAIIYIQGIIAVSAAKSEEDPVFTNLNINDKNVAISRLADGVNTFYLDVNSVLTDKNGNLKAEYTFDEIHMYAQYYAIWTRFLKKHAVVR